MSHQFFSLHKFSNGKWAGVLAVKERSDYSYRYDPPLDFKALIDEHYDLSPEQLARILLDSVLDAEAVELSLFSGPTLRLRRSDGE